MDGVSDFPRIALTSFIRKMSAGGSDNKTCSKVSRGSPHNETECIVSLKSGGVGEDWCWSKCTLFALAARLTGLHVDRAIKKFRRVSALSCSVCALQLHQSRSFHSRMEELKVRVNIAIETPTGPCRIGRCRC